MADLQKTIEIIINGTDNSSSTFNSVAGNLTTVQNRIAGVADPLATVTKGLLASEAAVISLAAVYAGFSINESIKFQTAQIDLAKVLSDTDPKIESFTQTVLDLSEEYGVASANILQGIANFKQAGFTAEESALLQKTALDLVIAGDVEATQATEILIASLKGFGAEAGQSTRFVEALNNVSNEYATDLGELSLGMSRISPIAKKMGFSFEETTGLITPVIEVFRSGPEAANALRTGLLKLIDDSAPVGDALAELGVSQKDVNGEMRSGKDIFLDVATAFQTLDENQKLVITSQLVGTEQAGKMVEVFDNLSKVQAITAVALEKTGSVTDEVALRLKSAGKQIDIFTISFSNLAKAVGDELLPGFGDVTGAATDIVQAFRDIVASGGLSELFNELDAQSAEFATFLRQIAQALPEAFEGLEFGELIASFGNLKDSISGIFGDLDLTKPEDLKEALQGLVDFLELMTNASAGAIDGIRPLIEGVATFLEGLANSSADSQNFIGLIGGIGTSVSTVLPLLGFLADAIILVGSSLTILSASKGLPALNTITSRLTGISPTNVALAGAIGAVTFAVDQNVKAYDDYIAREEEIQSQIEHTNELRDKQADRLKEISETTGVTVTSMEELNTALEDGRLALDDSEIGYRNTKEAVRDFDAEVEQATNDSITWKGIIADVTDTLGDMGIAVDGSATSTTTLAKEQEKLNALIKQAEKDGLSYRAGIKNGIAVIDTWGDSHDEAGKKIEEVTDGLGELTEREKLVIENTQEMELTLLKLASNEKIKTLEFVAEMQIAEFERDAKIVEATMEGLVSIFESTGEVLTALTAGFDASFTDADRQFFKDKIDERLKLERDAFDQTKRLQDAQIKEIEARAKIIAEGGSVVRIVAPDLAPHLQLVLKSMVEDIALEVTNQGLEVFTV